MLFISSMLFLNSTTETKIRMYWEDIHIACNFYLLSYVAKSIQV